jgi:hypothetical protein
MRYAIADLRDSAIRAALNQGPDNINANDGCLDVAGLEVGHEMIHGVRLGNCGSDR